MRTTYLDASVRLYFLDAAAEGGAIETLFYGPLSEAMQVAGGQPEEVQAGLYMQTDNDVVAWLDLIGED
ncbi:hypothetical protein [Aurantiacibacter zhengii]|uniref:Uncharacterized protein n=1 Tax=Aurantiacibacter zhengii TaxID=2307003 RepID=A0A418NX04_9SPHN|nr:hypothetical protein [Aurantiacibacter zhengii]RIV89143.1 hypothetical protein D2V07_02550 [Aurantiacibacter zhengii]